MSPESGGAGEPSAGQGMSLASKEQREGLPLAKEARGKVVAVVRGHALNELPKDLYIPPDALQVFLEAFEGPLDLLLYLIRRQNLDILDIKVAEVTDQYLHYIELMQALKLDLAGEYLLMAAMLAEIKSRLLLPRPAVEDEEADPRAELVRRLQEYERIKTAAERLDELPREGRDFFPAQVAAPAAAPERPPPAVDMKELLLALAEVLHRADLSARHAVSLETLSVRARMSEVLARVHEADGFVPFAALFDLTEGRQGVVVTFLALLELLREALLELAQNAPFAPIYVRAPTATSQPATSRQGG